MMLIFSCLLLFVHIVKGEFIYGRQNGDVTLECPYRDVQNDGFGLVWKGPPYTSDTDPGQTYITSNDGVNPNTVLGVRLSMTGDHTAGEYNMKISDLQPSDAEKYYCEYTHTKVYYLRLVIAVSSVTINPQNITATEGGAKKSVTCTTSDSNPAASVYWYLLQQGATVPMNITNQASNTPQGRKTVSTLSYSGQRLDNGGRIYCNATNGWETGTIQSNNAIVTVYYKPSNVQITPAHNPYIVYVGQSGVQLNCSAKPGNPPDVSYKWSYNGVDRAGSTYQITVIKESSGAYRCTASNTAGSSSATVNIKVLYAPEIQALTKQQPKEGDMFSLTCVITSANPIPAIQQIWWTKHNDANFRQDGNMLILNNILRNQSETYTCHASNTATPSGETRSVTLADSLDVEVDVLYKPLLVISPTFNPLFIYVGQPNAQLSCGTSDANPLSVTYRWTYSGTTRHNALYDLTPVSTGSGGNYICYGTNTAGTSSSTVTVNVQYGPSIGSISARRFITGRDYRVECRVIAEPQASVSWTGPNSLQHNTNVLQFNGVTKSQDGSYTCQASNRLTPSGQLPIPKSANVSVDVDVLYKPEVLAVTSPSVLEGDTLNISCIALANPPASYSWTKSNSGFQQTGSSLVIANINKTHSGTYKCTATNTMNPTEGSPETGQGQRNVIIKVKYQPSIESVGLIGNGQERNEGDYTSIKCIADSYPAADITWTTSTGNNRPTYQEKSTETKHYYNFTAKCLDTGNYTCTANNRIGKAASGQLSVFIRCFPRIDNRHSNTDPKIGIKNGEGLNITIAYLAYPTANVTWTIYSNSTGTNHSKSNSDNGTSIINKSFVYWQTSDFVKPNMTEDDFGIYTVTFRNAISASSFSYVVGAERTPDAPILESVNCWSHKDVNVTWIPKFDGGSDQHFIIQYRKDGETSFTNWTHKILHTKSNITETLDDLFELTKYHFRVVAVNFNGDVPSASEDSCITLKEIRPPSPTSSPVVAAVGGSIGVVAGIAIVLIAVILWRRKSTDSKRRDGDFAMNGSAALTPKDSDEEDGMRDNILYESAGPDFQKPGPSSLPGGKNDYVYSDVNKVNTAIPANPAALYAVVQKQQKIGSEKPVDPSAVYAEVQKPKATGKEQSKGKKLFGKANPKKGKADMKKESKPAEQGTVYENVADFKKSDNSSKGTANANVDELPGPSGATGGKKPKPPKAKKPLKRKTNKDGLIYADLELEDQPATGKKFVIRGLENKTDYAEVDFSRRAEPLPPEEDEMVDNSAEQTKDDKASGHNKDD